MSSLPELRQRLEEGGFRILEERLGREGDTLYVVMRAEAGEAPLMTPAQLWAGRQSPGSPAGGLSPGPAGEAGPGAGRPFPGERRAGGGPAAELAALRQELLEMREEWEAWQR